MFNVCFTKGTFPDLLKIAEVVPIFKKGEHSKMTNYRSISLLSQFNKIFKKSLYIKSMQTLATVHETFYHLQYICIFTQTLYIRTFSSLPKTPHEDLE